MNKLILKNARIVNENKIFFADVYIEDKFIAEIGSNITKPNANTIDLEGNYLLPGVIDDQVHFREPGLTHKATIATESKAAVAGGITSFIEQPNTIPNAITHEILENKYAIAKQSSYANYSFMLGGTNSNLDEILKTNKNNVAGIKLFLGSSTGNMLVDDDEALHKIFSSTQLPIALHCEDEHTIKENLEHYKSIYGENIPIEMHPLIRSDKACYLSSSKAIKLAKETGARIHIFHVSTELETHLFANNIPLENKKITSEVCIHHLWFTDKDYLTKGNLIKWNPAVKTEKDKNALWQALLNDKIDVVATDHAPHTWQEKQNNYSSCPSGAPMVQHALVAMLQMHHKHKISLEKIVEKMCHNPAKIFNIDKRGFIKEGYYADVVAVNLNKKWRVSKENILYHCKWSPMKDEEFYSKISHTFVNGNLVYENDKVFNINAGERLLFNR